MFIINMILIIITIIMNPIMIVCISVVIVITQRLTARPHLDGFDQVGSAVGHLLGRLDKVPLGRRVGGLGRSQAAGVAQRRRVLGNNGCS